MSDDLDNFVRRGMRAQEAVDRLLATPCGCPIRDGFGHHGPNCPAIDDAASFVADPVHDGYVDRAAEARADQRGEDGAR